MTIGTDIAEKVFLSEEGTPGTLEAVTGATDYLAVVPGSVNVQEVHDGPIERTDSGGRMIPRLGAAPFHVHQRTGLQAWLKSAPSAGDEPQWVRLLEMAGWVSTVTPATSAVVTPGTLPNVTANQFACTLRHEVAGEDVQVMHGARVGGFTIEMPQGRPAMIDVGEILGGYNAPTAWSAFTAHTEIGEAFFSLYDDPGNNPFRFDSYDFDVVTWRLRWAGTLGLRASGSAAYGHLWPAAVSRGIPALTIEADVQAFSETDYGISAKALAATEVAGQIILKKGSAKMTINAYDVQWSAVGRVPGNPSLRRLVGTPHYDGTNEGVKITLV